MDLDRMTLDQVQDEARRRAARRSKNLPLNATPEEEVRASEERIAEEDARLEKQIQSDVRKLYIAFGCDVYSLSQARASKQSPGLSDLIVFHRRFRCGWLHETKTPRGVQSPAQKYFADCCELAGWKYVLGGVLAAETQLIGIGAAYRDSSGALEPRQ